MTTLPDQSEFNITSGNCGTSEIWKPTFDHCIVIQKTVDPKNVNRRVALKFVVKQPNLFEVRFFENTSNTYTIKKTLLMDVSTDNADYATSISDIIKFLEDSPTPNVTEPKIRILIAALKKFINNTEPAHSSDMIQYLDPVFTTITTNGGSHKRYRTTRKTRKHKSRKQSRRQFQRRKRTHRRKSRRSRRSRK